MSQREDVLAALSRANLTPREISEATGVGKSSVDAVCALLKKDGIIKRVDASGIGIGTIWGVCAAAPAPDDPTMIPGGPLPACEIAAETETAFAAADFAEPDDETPTARAVALAVVAAAQSLGEDPTQIAVAGIWLRCRFAAVKALAVYYDGCSWEQLGRFVGFVKLTQKAVDNALNFPWWEDAGDPAFEAAVSALEAA